MDKQQKKEKTPWGKYAVKIVSLCIGAVCGFLIASGVYIKDMELSEYFVTYVLAMTAFIIEIFIQTIIHEAGHLVFGLISGYRFSSFRIGNLMWVKNNEKISFKRMNIAGTGGQCLMSPPEMVDGNIPFVLYNLGGPLFNMLSSAIFFSGYVLYRNVPFVSTFLLLISVLGLAFALINGIPMRLGSIDNDGYNALSLGRTKEALRSFWVQLKISEQLSKGARLKDLPDEWFSMPSDEGMKNSMTAIMGVFYANRLIDLHHFAEADELIEKMLFMDTAIVGLYRNLLVCDKIYCEIVGQNREAEVQAMLDKKQKQFMKQMRNSPAVLRTQYAITFLFEKNSDKAKQYIEKFEKCAKTYPYQGDVKSERELLKVVKEFYVT